LDRQDRCRWPGGRCLPPGHRPDLCLDGLLRGGRAAPLGLDLRGDPGLRQRLRPGKDLAGDDDLRRSRAPIGMVELMDNDIAKRLVWSGVLAASSALASIAAARI